jgi:hypothetical protein
VPPHRRAPSRLIRSVPSYVAAGVSLLLLGGCLNGDFGRVRPSLVSDDTHNWVGRQAAHDYAGRQPSNLPLTDDERQLRDLAFPLIEAPFDRGRWDSALLEWGITRSSKEINWPPYDRTVYGKRLLARAYRSPAGRYAQLIDDVRNDTVRIAPFVAVARRVLDMDGKRQKSMAYVSHLSAGEYEKAQRRMTENTMVVAWVQNSLRERADAYQYALERCVIATPFPAAVEAERSLNELRQQIAGAQLVPLPRRVIAAAAG